MKYVNLLLLLTLSWSQTVGQTVNLQKIDDGYTLPLALTNAHDGSNRIFVVEKVGTIKLLNPNGNDLTVFDISARVDTADEMGLLGLAFDPDFTTNHYFYVNYNITRADSHYTHISRFTMGNNTTDLSTEKVLLEYYQPFTNHKGGTLEFDSDGLLYISAGDGGLFGDPYNNAQNLHKLLGKILRIDVSQGNPYAIPSDNPFASSTDGKKKEIYAYGLRNPWKFSIDEETGLIWVADVGQDSLEEVNILEKGANYGWHIKEGPACYPADVNCQVCDPATYTEPVFYYPHEDENEAIIGGHVYRGSLAPSLTGRYIFGDLESGRIWKLNNAQSGPSTEIFDADFEISSFGEDEQKELYVLNIFDGEIYQVTDASVTSVLKSSGSTINVHPNPAKEHVQVTGVDAGSEIILFSANGTQVSRTIAKSSEEKILTKGLAPGVYNLLISNETMRESIKVVITD